LDLTTAKLIKGKVITNGDVMTYLKLKKEVAKRLLFDLYSSKKIQGESLNWCEKENGQEDRKRPNGVLNIKTSAGKKTIYHYRKEFENILINKEKNIKYNKENIKNSLNHYLSDLRSNTENHTPSIQKINHLRDAITANMVGVICHLQKTYPGFVILEDLDKSQIERHFSKNNENLSRRLENALYNKFQQLGLVPPHVKDIIQLREQFSKKKQQKGKRSNNTSTAQPNQTQSSQIGNIVFVSKEDTSRKCPNCEKKPTQNKKAKNDQKYRQNRFLCSDSTCGFDTYLFKEKKERVENYTPEVKEENKDKFKHFSALDDPDKVASYNITKKIKDSQEINKWNS